VAGCRHFAAPGYRPGVGATAVLYASVCAGRGDTVGYKPAAAAARLACPV